MPTAPKILCMYSGGLDSAGALWQLIHDQRYSEYEILVHHVQLLNITNRYYAERQAVDKTIPLFRSLTGRKLYLSSTILDFAFMAPKVPVDADGYGFVAANLANIDLNIAYIAIGRTADDETTGGDPLHHITNCVEKALSIAKIGKKTLAQQFVLLQLLSLPSNKFGIYYQKIFEMQVGHAGFHIISKLQMGR